jgi:5-methylcytosine-specific restriction endonuclease McrA
MRLRQKQPRVKLDVTDYALVRKLVLERDGWQCQECGSKKSLQVHHLKARSQLGGDTMQNLITLCVSCHVKAHGR